MRYRLTVIVDEPNPNYDSELEKYKNLTRYLGQFGAEPQPTREVRELAITLDENEYQAVRRAVLETFK